jgi:hypothetical protein
MYTLKWLQTYRRAFTSLNTNLASRSPIPRLERKKNIRILQVEQQAFTPFMTACDWWLLLLVDIAFGWLNVLGFVTP